MLTLHYNYKLKTEGRKATLHVDKEEDITERKKKETLNTVRLHDKMAFWFMIVLQPTVSGTPGARGAAALSPVTADGRGERGCVRGQRWRGSSATAAVRKSESAATSAVQVSQDNKAFPLDESEEIMTSSGWTACLIMYDQVELMQGSAVPTSLSLSQGSTDKLRKKTLTPICDAKNTLRISVLKRGFLSL